MREVVLTRGLRDAIERFNPDLPASAVDDAVRKLTQTSLARTTIQHNQEFYGWIRDGVPVTYRDNKGRKKDARAKVINFRDPADNRFLVVRALKIQGLRSPHYNRRADLVCFVNGLPLVFVELKNVWTNIRNGFDQNLSDYKDTIPHAFYHNAFLVVSNGDDAKYGSLTRPRRFEPRRFHGRARLIRFRHERRSDVVRPPLGIAKPTRRRWHARSRSIRQSSQT